MEQITYTDDELAYVRRTLLDPTLCVINANYMGKNLHDLFASEEKRMKASGELK